ncbi:hypothetical protein Tco_0308863 [Tanacetum coccineum]
MSCLVLWESKQFTAGSVVLTGEYEDVGHEDGSLDHNIDQNCEHCSNGQQLKRTGRDPKGNIMILPPVSVEEHIAVQRETKARTILLHQIWDGNGESKKMRGVMLKQDFSEFSLGLWKLDVIGLAQSYDSRDWDISLEEFRQSMENWQCSILGLNRCEKLVREDEGYVQEGNSWILKQAEEDATGNATGNATGDVADDVLLLLLNFASMRETSLWTCLSIAVGMHAVPPPITGHFMPPSNNPDLDDTQFTYGLKSNNYSKTNSVSNDFVSCDNSDKSSDSQRQSFCSPVFQVSCPQAPRTNDP